MFCLWNQTCCLSFRGLDWEAVHEPNQHGHERVSILNMPCSNSARSVSTPNGYNLTQPNLIFNSLNTKWMNGSRWLAERLSNFSTSPQSRLVFPGLGNLDHRMTVGLRGWLSARHSHASSINKGKRICHSLSGIRTWHKCLASRRSIM